MQGEGVRHYRKVCGCQLNRLKLELDQFRGLWRNEGCRREGRRRASRDTRDGQCNVGAETATGRDRDREARPLAHAASRFSGVEAEPEARRWSGHRGDGYAVQHGDRRQPDQRREFKSSHSSQHREILGARLNFTGPLCPVETGERKPTSTGISSGINPARWGATELSMSHSRLP